MCSSNDMYGMYEDWDSDRKLTIHVYIYECLERYIKWVLKNHEQTESSINLAELTLAITFKWKSRDNQELTP